MTKVQFIRSPRGDELAVLPREEYERLTSLVAEAEEDTSARRLVTRARRALDKRREVAVSKAVADGHRPAKAPRGASHWSLAISSECTKPRFTSGIQARRTNDRNMLPLWCVL